MAMTAPDGLHLPPLSTAIGGTLACRKEPLVLFSREEIALSRCRRWGRVAEL